MALTVYVTFGCILAVQYINGGCVLRDEGNEWINVNDFLLCSGDDVEEKRVLVLSYPQYCRYRSVIARLRERPTSLLTDHVVLALGGIASLTNNTQILYCRDTFDHPTLVENDSVCDEFGKCLFCSG